VELPVRTLFQAPTVTDLAREIERLRAEGASASSATIPSVSRELYRAPSFEFPASLEQRRLWFLEQWEPETAIHNIPLLARLTGALDPTALERGLDSIIARHEALRTTFVSVDGEPMQVLAPRARFVLECVDLAPGPEPEARAVRLAEEEAR